MQTFLPYADFVQTSKCLDKVRLWKQFLESCQLIRGLQNNSGWKNHPAQKMWAGAVSGLMVYSKTMLTEFFHRGGKIRTMNLPSWIAQPPSVIVYPKWLGDERVHSSHRSNLLRKDPEWYGQFGWTEPSDMPYFWPSRYPELMAA